MRKKCIRPFSEVISPLIEVTTLVQGTCPVNNLLVFGHTRHLLVSTKFTLVKLVLPVLKPCLTKF
jgi:hypothetical protein